VTLKFAFAAALIFLASNAAAETAASVELRILAINDFHGNLRPPPGGIRISDPDDATKRITVPAGGAEHMATLVRQLRAGKNNTVFVAAGDLIGAKLYALNHEAVAQRYDEGESSTPYRWQPAGYQNRVRWYKAIQCLRYQCAEGDAPETPLYAELTALERIVASYIIDELPAYKEAPWDADRRDPRHAAAR